MKPAERLAIIAILLAPGIAPVHAQDNAPPSGWYRSTGAAASAGDIESALSLPADAASFEAPNAAARRPFGRPDDRDFATIRLERHDHPHFKGYCSDGLEPVDVQFGTALQFAEIGEFYDPGERYDSHLSIQHDTKNPFARATIDWDGVF